jgi:hypothetical protein
MLGEKAGEKHMVLFTRVASISEAYTMALTMAAALVVASTIEVTKSRYNSPAHDSRDQPSPAFIVWATIVLTGLAIVSVALGLRRSTTQ